MEKMEPGTSSPIPHARQKEEPLLRFAVFAVGPRVKRTRHWQRRACTRCARLHPAARRLTGPISSCGRKSTGVELPGKEQIQLPL